MKSFKEDMAEFENSKEPVKFEKLVAEFELYPQSDVGWKREIVELFEKTGHDYRDASSWFTLVGFIANTLFHKGKIGRPRKWKRPSNQTLKRDFVSCLKADPELKKPYVLEEMAKKFPRKYGPIDPSTLSKWVSTEINVVEERRKVKEAAKAGQIRRKSAPISLKGKAGR
jgi:hypothetical protein